MRSAVARRRKGFETRGRDPRHRLIADETVDDGGGDAGPRPTELLAAALASCTTITIVMYADRKGWDVGAIEVGVDYEPPTVEAPPSFEVRIKDPGRAQRRAARAHPRDRRQVPGAQDPRWRRT